MERDGAQTQLFIEAGCRPPLHPEPPSLSPLLQVLAYPLFQEKALSSKGLGRVVQVKVIHPSTDISVDPTEHFLLSQTVTPPSCQVPHFLAKMPLGFARWLHQDYILSRLSISLAAKGKTQKVEAFFPRIHHPTLFLVQR
jgi:hypothetical protein